MNIYYEDKFGWDRMLEKENTAMIYSDELFYNYAFSFNFCFYTFFK